MNIQGGGLSFEISGTNKQLLSVLNESKKAIQEFQGAAVLGGKQMDAAFERAGKAIDKAFANIDLIVDTNKAAISELEAEYNRLGASVQKALAAGQKDEATALQNKQAQLREEITLRRTIIDEAGKQADALMREEQQLRKAQEAAQNNANAHQSLRAQLRAVREQLGQMEEVGLRGTDTFRQLQQEAGRLANAIGDAQTQARIFSHDNAGLQGMISGLSGVAGAFSAAQGAVALFAGENENLQKIMLKVQALMSVTMGLQQVANTLNKDSAFMLTTVARAKELLAAANVKLAAALGISTVAAQALMATLTLGLSVAITAVIAVISKFNSKQAEAKKAADEFNKKVAEASGKPIAAYRALQAEWLSLSGSLKDREKWVQDNADKFNDLGYKVRNAKEAEELLIKNAPKFVEACILKAKALAAQNLAAEKYQEIIKKQLEYDAEPETVQKLMMTGADFKGDPVWEYVTVANDKKAKLKKEMTDLQTSAKKFVEQQIQFTKEEQALLAQIGNQAGKVVEGSVAAAEKELQRLRGLYNDAATDMERSNLAKQIAAQQAEVDRLSLKTTSGSGGGSGKDKDPFAEMLATRKGLYEKYLKWMTSSDETVRNAAASEFAPLLKEGNSYLDYLEKQRAAIEAKTKKTAADLKNLTTLNNEIANATRESVISAFDAQLQQELAQCKTISEMLAAIERRRSELSGDNSDVDNAKAEMLKAAESEAKEQVKEETKALLNEYAAYLQEKIAFEESYTRNRELLSSQVARIEERLQAQAATAQSALAATSSAVAENIKDISAQTANEISGMISGLENKKVSLGSLSEAEEKLLRELKEAKALIDKENPFTGLQESLLKLRAAMTSTTIDTNDPFIVSLLKRKEQYKDYAESINSEDAIFVKAVQETYKDLLNEGATFVENLKNKISALKDKQINIGLNLEEEGMLSKLEAVLIAEEGTATKITSEIKTSLLEATQNISSIFSVFSNAASVAEQNGQAISEDIVNLLAQFQAIATQTGANINDVTERAQNNTANITKEVETLGAALSALTKIDTSDLLDVANLQAQAATAQSALAALEAKREEYGKRSGNEQYDALLQEYQTYQQQETAILEKYAAQRALAEQQGNTTMIGQINAKQQSELSKLAAQRLMASESWAQLFSDISRLSTTTINRLLNDINNRKVNLSAEFNPADLKAINDQLQKAKNELQTRNPFLALKQSLSELRAAMKAEKLLDSDDPFVKSLEEKKKQYADYTDAINGSDKTLAGAAKEAYADLLAEGSSYVDMLRRKIATLNGLKIKGELSIEGQEQLDILNAALNKEQGVAKSVGQGFKDAFADIGGSLTFLSSCFGSVVSGIKKMGVSMDEETEAILGDIGGMLDGASQIATGIATANPLSIIQGSIGFLSSAFDLFNSRDRKAEKSIKKHEEAVTRLGRAYAALEHAVDNALGETVYQNQSALIGNLRQQQNEIRGMISDEYSKKKTDYAKIEEYQERIAEANRQIEDITAEITQTITQTSGKEAAAQLMDAIVNSCGEGEDALKSLNEVYKQVADDILKKAVANALKLQFLEKPLQAAIKQLQKDMGFDEEGNGTFDGLTEDEQARFRAAVAAAGANFKAAMDMYKDLFAELDDSDPTSLSGAIKGASQESIDLLAGQTNAVRQNQVVSIEIFRQQLARLTSMDNRLGSIAGTLISILNRLGIDDGDDLRSQGITD